MDEEAYSVRYGKEGMVPSQDGSLSRNLIQLYSKVFEAFYIFMAASVHRCWHWLLVINFTFTLLSSAEAGSSTPLAVPTLKLLRGCQLSLPY